MNIANYVTEITVVDPESKLEVGMSVFKHIQSGGMFALDNSYLEQMFEDDVNPIITDPFNKGRALRLIGD